MAKVVVDFSKAPPVTKGSKFDKIPEGAYLFKVAAEATESKGETPHPMVNVTLGVAKGPQKGRRILDTFWLPVKRKDSVFGLQRLHGLMVACGIKEQDGQTDLSAVVNSLNKDRQVIAVVRDNVMPAQGDYEERTVSRPDEYLRTSSKDGQRLLAGGGGDDEDAGDEDDEEDEEKSSKKSKPSDDEDEDDDEDDKPAKKKKAKKSSDDDDDEDDEDDEEEKPKKKGKKKADDDFDDEDED